MRAVKLSVPLTRCSTLEISPCTTLEKTNWSWLCKPLLPADDSTVWTIGKGLESSSWWYGCFQAQVQSFVLAHLNTYPMYDLLGYMKGPALQIQGCRSP